MSFNTPQQIAADIVTTLTAHPERWLQGFYYDERDGVVSHCLVGHIAHRARGFDLSTQTCNAYKTLLGINCLSDWNDSAERTVADIIAVSRRVAVSHG